MKIEEIESLWETDSKIDSADLSGESIKTPPTTSQIFQNFKSRNISQQIYRITKTNSQKEKIGHILMV